MSMRLNNSAVLGRQRPSMRLIDSGDTWESYITSLLPLAWYRMRQTAGTNEPNAGSVGASADMTITSATLGQTGRLGANEAYLLDGVSSRLQTPNNATLAALTSFEYVFLVNPATAGEGSAGNFFCWGNGSSSSEAYLRFQGGIGAIQAALFNTSPSAFNTNTTAGLSTSTWALLFLAFDNAGDRRAHVYRGVSGVVTEYGYSAQPAMTGTFKAPILTLNIGNRAAQDQTYDGLIDEALIFNGNLTPAQRLQMCLLAGV